MSELEVSTPEIRLAARLRVLPWRAAMFAGLGGFVAIAVVAGLADMWQLALLIPPFGASSVLLFALPASPLAQPRNVIGGHLVAASAGLIAVGVFGPAPWTIASGVGLAITAMMLTGTLHPPAGANPIIIGILTPGWSFLLVPVLLGTVCLVVTAMFWHRLISKTTYPVTWQ